MNLPIYLSFVQTTEAKLSTELVTMLNASGVACFQYVEDELDNYYIVVSVFSGPSPAPETQFFIISMRFELSLVFGC